MITIYTQRYIVGENFIYFNKIKVFMFAILSLSYLIPLLLEKPLYLYIWVNQ